MACGSNNLPGIHVNLSEDVITTVIDTAAMHSFVKANMLSKGITTSPHLTTNNLAAAVTEIDVHIKTTIFFLVQGRSFEVDYWWLGDCESPFF